MTVYLTYSDAVKVLFGSCIFVFKFAFDQTSVHDKILLSRNYFDATLRTLKVQSNKFEILPQLL